MHIIIIHSNISNQIKWRHNYFQTFHNVDVPKYKQQKTAYLFSVNCLQLIATCIDMNANGVNRMNRQQR